jgi:AraC-like DNA-binding protein
VEDRSGSRVLHAAPGIAVGEFRCPPHDPAWRSLNWIGDSAHLAFPSVPVGIAQLGRPPLLATSNHVVFYAAGQEYRRSCIHDIGDVCLFLAVEPQLLERELEEARLAAAPRLTQGPCEPAVHLAARLLRLALARRPASDALVADELALALLQRALAAASAQRAAAPCPRPATRRAREALVEAAKARLAARLAERLSLAALAGDLHVSPFHLARVFRAATGFALHEYRTQLRLRAALERVVEPDAPLARVAADLGLSSHAHLCIAFRSSFRRSPREVRRLARADLRDLSTILEVPGRRAA